MKKNKNKLSNFLKIGVLLFGVSLLLYNCERVNEIEINEPIETVSLNEALTFFNSNQKTLSKSSNSNYVTPNLDSISQQEITNSNELITVIKATTIYQGHYSRILLLKINENIEAVIFSMYENKNSNSEHFTGEILITKLDGSFVNGYRVENEIVVSQFIKSNNSKSTLAKSSSSQQTCPDHGPCTTGSLCVVCDQLLDEVVITGSSSSGGSFSIWTIFFDQNPDVGNSTEEWNYENPANGGGGNDSSNTCTGGKIKDTSENCVCPSGYVENSDGNCINLCEMAFLARDVQNINNGNQPTGTSPLPAQISGGWELNTTLNLSELNLTDSITGFNSAVYQKLENGKYKYMYVTEGTHDFRDLGTNISQFWGGSDQYEISVKNAIKLDVLVGNSSLCFVGHSLGGGLASANSLATGRDAFTYNAAGLSDTTKGLYDSGLNPFISATVVRGEFVDLFQRKFGLKAEGTINYIDYESSNWVGFLNRVSAAASTYHQLKLHIIESILSAMNCN